jgi:hypothetical protein
LTGRSFRWFAGLAGGCALLLVAVTGLSACGAPAYSYSADYSDNTYFKVPYGWHKLSANQVATALRPYGGTPAGVWTSAFDAGGSVSPDNFLSFATTSPFVFAEVGQLNSTATAGMSYNGLEDLFLPVTSTARQQIPSNSSLTNFKQVGLQMLTPGQGVHGVRVTFQYTDQVVAGVGLTDTFDEVALTNATDTEVYLLVVHCQAACYTQNQKAINDVMASFTVRSPG